MTDLLIRLKGVLRDTLGVSPLVLLLVLGAAAHIGTNLVLRKPLIAPVGMWGPLLLGIAIETWEIFLAYRDIGLFAPGNDPIAVILGRHALDVLAMLAVPMLLVCIGLFVPRS